MFFSVSEAGFAKCRRLARHVFILIDIKSLRYNKNSREKQVYLIFVILRKQEVRGAVCSPVLGLLLFAL